VLERKPRNKNKTLPDLCIRELHGEGSVL